MIKENTSLSMTEALEYIDDRESRTQLKGFIKKFAKLNPEQAKKLREKIQNLDLLKIKQEHISKIIDLLPENKENLNKIFTDVSLTEDESKQILDSIEEFK